MIQNDLTYTKDEIFVLLKPGQEVKQDSLLNVTWKKLDNSLEAYSKLVKYADRVSVRQNHSVIFFEV